ncbi:Digeranylgeranylglycerophospholipid reductase [uncultured archaeon]|nr:Digeranylgeranylglycerophospholipid reductase [uncultured archaeon]
MPDSPIYDVSVIGAGPAGCSAAYSAAKEGLSTVILEEHPRVGEPVHCGECLSAWATKRMGLELPDEAVACRVKGIRVLFPDNTAVLWREEGYVLDKHVFEQFLAVRAQGAGAALQTGTRVSSMKRENGVWALGATRAGGASSTFRARSVIDASGYEAVSTRLTGVNSRKFDMVSGAQYLMEDIPQDGFIDFYLWPRLAPHGYLWMIPKRNGAANVGLVTNEAANAHKYLKQFVQEMGWTGKKIIRPFGGMIPSSGPMPRIYSDGLLLAGDAAGFTSPMFEGGTQLALKSGEFAARVLARARSGVPKPDVPMVGTDAASPTHSSGFAPTPSGDPFSAHALSEYENLCRDEFPPYEKLVRGKAKFYSFSDPELSAIGRMMPTELVGMTALDKAGIAAQTLLRFGLRAGDVRDALDTFSYSVGEKYGW